MAAEEVLFKKKTKNTEGSCMTQVAVVPDKEAMRDAAQAACALMKVLSNPDRLLLLCELSEGERNVGELAQLCSCSPANVYRHLSLLSQHGLVRREGRGTAVYYRIADDSVYALCDLVCGNIARRYQRSQPFPGV